ncbi:MAG: cell division protein FtsZ [Bacteroidales bacterium]|nr:cell division protein FtsZ [Candidatus Physcousia equi]
MPIDFNANKGIDFGFKPSNPSIIKVIGVGGGGGNAVNHMFNEGIHDVTYVLCNTDNKALTDSPVPHRLQLGKDGLGAGNNPERAKAAALESINEIKEMLNDGTRMVFITAGMGGGTGTGAAPIIAQCAKDAGILTVGIVTIPFKFEGQKKILQALDGVEEISKHVDSLLVINNERLRELYPELSLLNAFNKADDTLSIAAKSIAEIITMHGKINLDFQDVTTVLKDGGVAIMSTGYGEGENRVTKAIQMALDSPLLNKNDITNSERILLNLNFSEEEDNGLTMEEMNELHEFMGRFRNDLEMKWGVAIDNTLGPKVKITVLATGFGLRNVPDMPKEKWGPEPETDEQKELLIEDYYGSNNNESFTQRRPNVYIFKDEDLDNNDTIAMVENTPTYERSKEDLKKIQGKVQTAEANSEEAAPESNHVSF